MKCTSRELPEGAAGCVAGGLVAGGVVGWVAGGVVAPVEGVVAPVEGVVAGVEGWVASELGLVAPVLGWEAIGPEEGELLTELAGSEGTQMLYSGATLDTQPASSNTTNSQLVIVENSFLFFIKRPLSVNFTIIIP